MHRMGDKEGISDKINRMRRHPFEWQCSWTEHVHGGTVRVIKRCSKGQRILSEIPWQGH